MVWSYYIGKDLIFLGFKLYFFVLGLFFICNLKEMLEI